MFCGKCGSELPDGAKFCDKCGAVIDFDTQERGTIENTEKGVSAISNLVSSQVQQEPEYLDKSSYNQLFVEADEQLLGTLGNGWITNILFHKLKKCNALLTNKRLYLQGTFFSGSGKSMITNQYEKVIDLEDITGSGFLYTTQSGFLIHLIIMMVLSIIASIISIVIAHEVTPGSFRYGGVFGATLGCIALGIVIGVGLGSIIPIIQYIKGRRVYFIIEYAGGGIRFDASIIGIADVRDFQKQIRRAKDKAKGKI